MHSESSIVDVILERQAGMRREMDRRGMAMKIVAQDSRIPYQTLLTYFPADSAKKPAQIPASAVYALTGVIPSDILSLLLPDRFLVLEVTEGIDHDEFASHCRDFLSEKDAAHHPQSEAGRDIGPGEDHKLKAKAVPLTLVKAA